MKANAPPSADPVLPPADPSAPAAPRAAAWPEWFAALDVVLALVGVVLAFLLGSFAARNSDLWLHLAGGRLIAEGQLNLGTDPFGFVAPDRPWVHTSWLTDLAAYLAYKADPTGVILVGVKAAVFAVAFGLFYFLRRPGHALWPWAVVGVLAVLAAAPYAILRPAVVSVAFLSLTMVLIGRLPWRANSWREPLILAGVFAVWANADAWFFLGPLAVACVLLGELVNRTLLGAAPPATAADPFPPAPPVPALVKALGLGVVAVLLNPFFLAAVVKDPGEAVAQLVPMELGFGIPAGASENYELGALTMSPLTGVYQSRESLGYGVNGFSYAALLVAGVLTLVLGFARLRAAHVLLWLAFAGLSLLHVRLIPYFAVVIAPLVAGHLNGLSGALTLGRSSDPKTRILLTACGLGRVLCLFLAFVMVTITYPGWLHPQSSVRAAQNRLDWALAPDAGMERSAKLFAARRADGTIPDGLRGLGNSAEFGNYLAWHAPGERAFVNTRYPFHRHELPDLIAARQISGPRRTPAEVVAKLNDLNRVAADRAAGYFAVTSPPGQRIDMESVLQLLNDDAHWVLWHLDGRSAIFGRVGIDPAADARAKGLKFDTARPAFGPGLPRLPAVKAYPPMPVPQQPAELYIDRPLPTAPGSDDAAVARLYAEYAQSRGDFEYGRTVQAEQLARWALIGGGRGTLFRNREPDDEQLTVPVLMIRAARQAVAANPESADAYAMLVEAYAMPGAPVLDTPLLGDSTERFLQTITAQYRFLERTPSLDASTANPQVVLNQAIELSRNYEQTGQLDAAKFAFDKFVAYFESMPEGAQKEFAASISPAGGKPEDALKARKADMSNQQDAQARKVQRTRDAVARNPDPMARFSAAAQSGLPLYAIELFDAIPPDPAKPIPPQMVIAKIVMEVRAGRLDEASSDLAALDDKIQDLVRQDTRDEIGRGFQMLQMAVARLEGNPGSDAAALPRPAFPKVVWDPTASRIPAVMTGLQSLAGGHVVVLLTDQGAASRTPIFTYLGRIGQAREVLLQESLLSYDRAMLALLDGNAADAKSWLLDSLKPQGVPLADIGDAERVGRAERYLKLIERAEKPRAK